MKKITFLFSVMLMVTSLSACGNTNTTAPDNLSSQAESTAESVTESTTEQLIEVDPFKGIDIVELYHEYGGNVYEYPLEAKDIPEYDSDYLISYGLYFDDKPRSDYSSEEITNFDSNVKCTVKIYDGSDNGLVYGDELVEMVKSKYGILLTETEKELPWAFKEKEPIEIDPFEGIESCYSFYKTPDTGKVAIYLDQSFMMCKGFEKCEENNALIDYDILLNGETIIHGDSTEPMYNLNEGDVLTLQVIAYGDDKVYAGDEVIEFLAKDYVPVKLTQTEKEITVTPSED